jgi:hypothetical protein
MLSVGLEPRRDSCSLVTASAYFLRSRAILRGFEEKFLADRGRYELLGFVVQEDLVKLVEENFGQSGVFLRVNSTKTE